MPHSHLANEWSLLQAQNDRSERDSLLIKLASVTVLASAVLVQSDSLYLALLIVILWLQEAIWKTFQTRTDARLLEVEQLLAAEQQSNGSDAIAYQLNSRFLAQRRGATGLIAEYLSQALRPTVAFPHAVLLVAMLARQIA